MNTLKKKVRVNKKQVTKQKVLDYYKKQWRKKSFKDTVTKPGLFVKADYNGKTVVKRKGIKVNEFKDLEQLVVQHAIELVVPVKQTGHRSYVDVDMPKKYMKDRRSIGRSLLDKLRKKKIKVKTVTDSPSGIHIFTNSSKSDLKNALKDIEQKDSKFHVGKTSKSKIVLDPYEPFVAMPGSLSIKGKPYKKW